jgi:hypothetical protein
MIIRKLITHLRSRWAYSRWNRAKGDQRITFAALSNQFAPTYDLMKRNDINSFVIPYWQGVNAELETELKPAPPFNFLKNHLISLNMFVNGGDRWLEGQLSFLENRVSRKRLKFLLTEDLAGDPHLVSSRYLTSHNSIHHLYTLLRFTEEIGSDFEKIETVVEWGGGYGNLAKIFRRLNPTSTYCIIDTPLFSTLQWVYLSTVLGIENVNLLRQSDHLIQTGKVNLVPLCFVDRLQLRADLFLSMWALSESSSAAQDYVISQRRWFDANHLLLAYQDTNKAVPNASRLGEIASRAGALTTDFEFLPGNYYAFR